MHAVDPVILITEQKTISSSFLKRPVTIDLYVPGKITGTRNLSLLLLNDGQDLPEMNFSRILEQVMTSAQAAPLVCVGIHAGRDRKNEYGTAGIPDYEGRGAKAAAYERFVLEELMPFIHTHFGQERFRQTAIAGFSLGGLSALNLAWRHPGVFSLAGVFSGSLWWRSKALDAGYNEDADRIMHRLVREGRYHPGQKFYFTTGSLDETADRNNNGIIDSIDDTLSLIAELEKLGYRNGTDIAYINYEDGRHDLATWGRSMAGFILWNIEQGTSLPAGRQGIHEGA